MPDDDEHGDAQRGRQLVNVDDVEPADRDALQHHRPDVRFELAPANQLDHPTCRVRPVALDVTAHNAVEPGPGAHGADEHDSPSMFARERPVVEADDVHAPGVRVAIRPPRRHGPPGYSAGSSAGEPGKSAD